VIGKDEKKKRFFGTAPLKGIVYDRTCDVSNYKS